MQDDRTVPYGFCHCGCGEKTTIAKRDHKKSGHIKGEPVRFIGNHWARLPRKTEPAWQLEDRGYDTPCWIWQRALNRRGYGLATRRTPGSSRLAHRWSYEHFVGPIPEGLTLDHLCRIRCCVNPAHLEPVTNAENGRRGANTKLTWDGVREIRALAAAGTSFRAIGRRFELSHNRVSEIVNRRNGAWID